jgi:hypothetical protein
MNIPKRLEETEAVHRRLDQVLGEDDRVIILADRHHVSCYVHGFAASPCQLELIEHELASILKRRMPPRPRDAYDGVHSARE